MCERENKYVFDLKMPFFTMIAMICMLMVWEKPSHAAASVEDLALYAEYKCNITGSKTEDIICVIPGEWSAYYYGYSGLKVKLNGKTAYSLKDYRNGFDAKLLTLSNGKTFLYITGYAESDQSPNLLLKYSKKTGKFKKVFDFDGIYGKYGAHVATTVKSVSGKKIVIQVNMVSWSFGAIQFDMMFKWESGNLEYSKTMTNCKIMRDNGKTQKTLTTNKKLTVYASKNLSGKKYTVKKNKKVTFSGFYLSGAKLRIKLKVNGKVRWIAPSKNFQSTAMIKHAFYYG